MNFGSGRNGELTFLDAISIISFCVGLQNLSENLTQGDKQELQKDLADKADKLLAEIHTHLEEQDAKIDEILKRLNNDSSRNI